MNFFRSASVTSFVPFAVSNVTRYLTDLCLVAFVRWRRHINLGRMIWPAGHRRCPPTPATCAPTCAAHGLALRELGASSWREDGRRRAATAGKKSPARAVRAVDSEVLALAQHNRDGYAHDLLNSSCTNNFCNHRDN
jgi:hypothetical protein